MSIRWLTCIALSLTVHVAWLCHGELRKSRPQHVIVPVAVAKAEPLSVMPEEVGSPLQTQTPDTSAPAETASPQTSKFRPNTEPEEPPKEVADQADEQPKEEQKQDTAEAEPTEGPASERAVATAEERKKEIETYRGRLLEKFEEQWQKVPELNTVIQDLALLPKIDGHFGIVVLAYSYVDHKPGPPFLLFDVSSGNSEKIDRFDFAQFSNRFKDRMLYAQYLSWLDEARRQHNIDSLMKVIGLVPARVDRYFSVKQLRAVQLAGISLDQARVTNGHYEPDGTGGFNLIIDSVTAKDGRTINIHDEELQFSVVAKK
jgi:hypothetical protein